MAALSVLQQIDALLAYLGHNPEPNPPLWPDSVYIFSDTDIDIARAQSIADRIQNNGHFSRHRHALLFKPGDYQGLTIRNLGYYTSIIGLGTEPQDTKLSDISCTNSDDGIALNNFWRSVENISIKPTLAWNGEQCMLYAVSQASPMRRVYIDGNLHLSHGAGYSSGGYIADSVVTGQIVSGTQQQFYVRNTTMGAWEGGVWNMVFQGCCANAPATVNGGHMTNIDRTPVIAEKPFISITADGRYKLNVPGLQFDKACTVQHQPKVRQIDFEQVYVASADEDTADSINAKLEQGKHIIFTPGLYYLQKAIQVKLPNIVLLGLGFATLIASNGNAVIEVGVDGENVYGVRVAGLLLDAGPIESDTLLRFGALNGQSSPVSEQNPAILSDIFARVGGANDSRFTQVHSRLMVQINSDHVICDHLWLWRADHDIGGLVVEGNNRGDTGLEVNGDNVICYGLAVEHTLKDAVRWNGNHGRCYFYQCELPYDVDHDSYGGKGFVGFRVNENVKHFQGHGMGIYCYFRDHAVTVKNALESAKDAPNVVFKNICTRFLNGKGGIQHIVNGVGGSSSSECVTTQYLKTP